MQPTPPPLNYQTPSRDANARHWTLIWIVSLVVAAVLLGMFVWAMAPSTPRLTPSKTPFQIPTPGIASNLINPSDIETQAAAAAATNTLDNLLAGKLDADPNLAPAARKVKGFQFWSIDSINAQSQPPARTFGGTLNSGDSSFGFSIQMVKQNDGNWQVAVFSGPNPN